MASYNWIHSSAYSSIPPNAVIGGNDEDGAMIYVGRAQHEADMLVCKIIPSRQVAFVTSNGGETISKDIFEVLCGQNLSWIQCYDHIIPENAILCGHTALEQPVYIGRGHYEGHLIVGKISSVHRALFITFRGSERRLESYEILVSDVSVSFEEQQKCQTPTTVCPEEAYPPYPINDSEPPPSYSTLDATCIPMPNPDLIPQPLIEEPLTSQASNLTVFIPADTYQLPSQSAPSASPPPTVCAEEDCANSFEENIWVQSTPYAAVPPFTVVGGYDTDRSPIYVGRAYHEGDNLPAKVIPSKGYTSVAWGGHEHAKQNFEVLVGENYAWITYAGGAVPPNAVRSGVTTTGESLFIGRGHHAGSLTVGKIHPSHGCLYVPYGGKELRLNTYEVLIYQQRDIWVSATASFTPPNAVVGGHDSDRSPIFVGKANHDGEVLPAKVVPSKGCAYVCAGGYEHTKSHFEILTGYGYVWMKPHHRTIPANAVSTGRSRNGEILYVGRGHHEGSLTVGLVSVSHHCLYIPYGGREIRLDSYEVLCRQ